MRRQAMKIVIKVQGTYARNQRLQRTWTPPTLSMSPRAVIDDAPAMTILSNNPAEYVTINNMPRPMLLPGPTPKASMNPKATDAMTTTQATPEGTMNVSSTAAMMRPRRIWEYVVPTRCMTRNAIRRAKPVFVAMVPNKIAPNKNQGVSVANPRNATSKGTTRNAQKR